MSFRGCFPPRKCSFPYRPFVNWSGGGYRWAAGRSSAMGRCPGSAGTRPLAKPLSKEVPTLDCTWGWRYPGGSRRCWAERGTFRMSAQTLKRGNKEFATTTIIASIKRINKDDDANNNNYKRIPTTISITTNNDSIYLTNLYSAPTRYLFRFAPSPVSVKEERLEKFIKRTR